jgi:hypothetical protein
MIVGFCGLSIPFEIALSLTPIITRPPLGQISPDKTMNLHCTTAPFTVPPEPRDFVVLCQLILGVSAFYDVSVRQLAALPPASDRPSLAGLPLLLASNYRRSDRRVDHLDVGSPTGDFHPIDSCPCWAYTTVLQRMVLKSRCGCRSCLPPLNTTDYEAVYGVKRVWSIFELMWF